MIDDDDWKPRTVDLEKRGSYLIAISFTVL